MSVRKFKIMRCYTGALRRAGRTAAAGFFKTPPPPKFGIGAPNAAAADNLRSPPA